MGIAVVVVGTHLFFVMIFYPVLVARIIKPLVIFIVDVVAGIAILTVDLFAVVAYPQILSFTLALAIVVTVKKHPPHDP